MELVQDQDVQVFVAVSRPASEHAAHELYDLYMKLDTGDWTCIISASGLSYQYLPTAAANISGGHCRWAILGFGHITHQATDFRRCSATFPTDDRGAEIMEAARQSWLKQQHHCAPASAPAPQKKVIVFLAVPSKIGQDCYEFWCKDRRTDGATDGWHIVLTQTRLDSACLDDLLGDSARWRSGTEHLTLILHVVDNRWEIASWRPQSPSIQASQEGLAVMAKFREDNAVPCVRPATQAPEPKKEEPEFVKCSFCEAPALTLNRMFGAVSGGDAGLRALAHGLHCCKEHPEALAHHAERIGLGLVDCPETRAESVRFSARLRADIASRKAVLTGYRTQNDLAKGALPTVTERAEREPPEEVPLAGQTPHYEWP
jgi:hypothetical protein